MPKIIKIEPHLSLEELETGYRQAKELVLRTHYQIIWLLAKGMSTQEVAVVTGYSRSWIYELVWGYNRRVINLLLPEYATCPADNPKLPAMPWRVKNH